MATLVVEVAEKAIIVQAKGPSRADAKQKAAQQALTKMRDNGHQFNFTIGSVWQSSDEAYLEMPEDTILIDANIQVHELPDGRGRLTIKKNLCQITMVATSVEKAKRWLLVFLQQVPSD